MHPTFKLKKKERYYNCILFVGFHYMYRKTYKNMVSAQCSQPEAVTLQGRWTHEAVILAQVTVTM